MNAVSPAYTDTPEWDKARLAMGRGDMEKGRELLDAKMLSRSPIQRWAAPDEIAQAVDFLCGEQVHSRPSPTLASPLLGLPSLLLGPSPWSKLN